MICKCGSLVDDNNNKTFIYSLFWRFCWRQTTTNNRDFRWHNNKDVVWLCICSLLYKYKKVVFFIFINKNFPWLLRNQRYNVNVVQFWIKMIEIRRGSFRIQSSYIGAYAKTKLFNGLSGHAKFIYRTAFPDLRDLWFFSRKSPCYLLLK